MEWIDINKQQPKQGQSVLITDGNMVTAAVADISSVIWMDCITWDACGWGGLEWDWDFADRDITHWMPLPAAPTPTIAVANGESFTIKMIPMDASVIEAGVIKFEKEVDVCQYCSNRGCQYCGKPETGGHPNDLD